MRSTDWEYFLKIYEPELNLFQNESDVYLFETYGEELKHIKSVNHRNLWTVISGDNGKLYITYGYHLVNRIGYIITKIPWPERGVRDYLY